MLGCDDTDSAILEILDRKESSVPDIAQKTGMSRTTVEYRLKRLLKYRLVEKEPSGGKTQVIHWRISASKAQFKRTVQVYRGRDVIRAHSMLEKIRKNTVMYTIEGKEATRIMRRELMSKTIGTQLQNMYRRRHIVRKTITHPDTLGIVATLSDSVYVHARRKQMIDLRLLPHKSLLGPASYVFTPEMLIIFNTLKQFAVVIRDELTTRMLYDMIALLFDNLEYMQQSQRFDYPQFMEHLIARNERSAK